MIKYLHIVPTAFINDKNFHVSNRHLVLGHLVDKINQYAYDYRNLADNGDEIILDNSYFEYYTKKIDYLLTVKQLIYKAQVINATYIVSPDTMYKSHLSYFIQLKINNSLDAIKNANFRTACVLTGEKLNDVFNCFNFLNRHKDVDLICIPDRLLVQKLDITRGELLDKLYQKFSFKKPLHLFAIDNVEQLRDIVKYKQFITSVDSTVAFKYGYNYKKFPCDEDIKRPDNYFDIKKIDDKQIECIQHNLQYIKTILTSENNSKEHD